MLHEPPEFQKDARILRTIQGNHQQPVYVMNDGTFRVYLPDGHPKNHGKKRFAVGLLNHKTDKEILRSAADLLTSRGVPFFREDGTPHN